MNKYLASENLPKVNIKNQEHDSQKLIYSSKQLEESKQHLRQLKKVLAEPATSERDFAAVESENKELNEAIAKLAEQRLARST